jgi:hypothetical protein
MQTEQFIQKLIEDSQQVISRVELLKDYDMQVLTWKENETSWNVLECLEHLNLYGDFYLPQIENEISNSLTEKSRSFSSGFIGNYFSKAMLPKEKLNKMKTFKDKDPINTSLDNHVLTRFIEQQRKLIELLNKSNSVNLTKVKIKTSLSSYVRLRLGDTFQFYVNHILRHMKQIENILLKVK